MTFFFFNTDHESKASLSYSPNHLYTGGSRSKETIYIPEDPGLNTAISRFLPNDVTVGGGHSGGGEVATPVEAKSPTP